MFEGFTPETVDFLWGIRMNNNREWFTAHKSDYVNTLYNPMKELGAHLYSLVEDKPGNLLKVSRIYRDARLHPSVPYKESLWICIRKDVQWWAEYPCLFFEICPEGVSYGLLLWQPKVADMDKFRKSICANPDAFLSLIRKTEKATKIPVSAQLYKKPKTCEDPRLTEFFRWKKGIACIKEESFSPETFGPELGDRALAFLEKLVPLYETLNRILSEE